MRVMTSRDVTDVVELEKILYPVDAWTGAQFLDELRNVPSTRYYVVEEEDGKIVGYAGVMVVGDQADIQTLSVAPSNQRAGLGQLLLTALESEVSRRGGHSIFLEVRTDNEPARSLYLKNGYREIGLRPDYYAPGIDACVMQKDLS